MGLINMAALRAGLVRGQRLIGLDPGSKTVGVALSDVGLMLASPWGGIARGKLGVVAGQLMAIVAAEGVGGFVVGYPCRWTGRWARRPRQRAIGRCPLSGVTGLPAALWDERLSSAAVNRMLVSEMDVSRRKRAAVVDGLARRLRAAGGAGRDVGRVAMAGPACQTSGTMPSSLRIRPSSIRETQPCATRPLRSW